MQLIMSYMSGNSLQIFSLMMVAMLFKGPFQAIASTNSTFSKLETEGNKGKMILVKATFVGMQFMLLALGVWKIGQMGLLPTTQSDWVAFEGERICLERAYFAT
jgi:ER membrane protein complex subunit 4